MKKKEKEKLRDFWSKKEDKKKSKQELEQEAWEKEKEERRKRAGRCECGCGSFGLSLENHEIYRTCKECGIKINVEEYVRYMYA